MAESNFQIRAREQGRKSMILYFTGTGNSRYIAKKMAGALGEELHSINDRIKRGYTEKIQVNGRLIFVTPTYAWRIPRVVEQWILQTVFTGVREVWFVMDCGGEIGDAAKYTKELCDRKKFFYMGTAEIVMPENYIAVFDAPGETKALEIIRKADAAIADAIRKIEKGQRFPERKSSVADRLKSGPVNAVFYPVCVSAKAFAADERCIGCGKCVKLCPLNNVKLVDKKPVWGRNCTHCMACICYCPTKAIEYGKKSVGKPRYQCPEADDGETFEI